jgi:hypothetical protein
VRDAFFDDVYLAIMFLLFLSKEDGFLKFARSWRKKVDQDLTPSIIKEFRDCAYKSLHQNVNGHKNLLSIADSIML